MTKRKYMPAATFAGLLLTGFLLVCGCACNKNVNTGGNSGGTGGNDKPGTGEYDEAKAFNLATFNTLCCGTGDYVWENRKNRVVKRMKDHDVDIFGVQETTPSQINELKAMLPEFTFYGMGRDGASGGEHVDIIYRTDRFKRLAAGQFWYSDTPDVPSGGWDGNFNRMCTWVKLEDRVSTKQFFVFNSHMALSYDGRVKSTELLLDKVAGIAGDTPAYCLGDFNSEPLEAPIAAMRTAMDDPFLKADKREGAPGTFNSLKPDFPVPVKRIDYCFMSKGAKAFLYKCIDDDLEMRAYASDHFPVMIKTVPSAD